MKTYPLTQAQFDALRARLQAEGVSIPATEYYGEISYLGVKLKFSFDGDKLSLSILKRPMLVSPSFIWEQVDKWVLQ